MAEHPKIVWMVSHPTAVWPLARVDAGTSDKCVDGGTSGIRVDDGSSDGRVALGRMKTHFLKRSAPRRLAVLGRPYVSIPSEKVMDLACGFSSVPEDRQQIGLFA